jgi:predicted Zn-dependent protease
VREMLAEMLLIDGKAKEALKEYQASLASDPNRFNGLLGAGRAAERLGDRDVAAGYYRALLANCTGATGSALVALRHPRAVVDEMAIGRPTITRKQLLISGMAGSPQDVHEYMP